MNKIFGSASKIVFIALAGASIGAMFLKIISGEQFLVLVSMAFTYYFTKPSSPTSPQA